MPGGLPPHPDPLSLSALHLEKYLAAAEEILDRAISTIDPAKAIAQIKKMMVVRS